MIKNKKGMEFQIIIGLILLLIVVFFFLWKFVFTASTGAQEFQNCEPKGNCRIECNNDEMPNPVLKCDQSRVCCVSYGD